MRQTADSQPAAVLDFDREPASTTQQQPEPVQQVAPVEEQVSQEPVNQEPVDEETVAGAHLDSVDALRSKPIFPSN